MRDYLHSKLVLVGLGLLIFGSGPFLGIIAWAERKGCRYRVASFLLKLRQ